jgi:site-specific DNA-methyltransferase (adenine-specific)
LSACYRNPVLIDDRWQARLRCVAEDAGLHWRETIICRETFGVHCERRFGKDHRYIHRLTRHPKRQVFHPDRVPSWRLENGDKRTNPRGRVASNVWTISRECGTFKERLDGFPTQLPLELLGRVVRTATDPGDLVVDPCSGSASTGMACVEQGRRYLGIEPSEGFAEAFRVLPARLPESFGLIC